jgi:hypothetical protein
MMSRHETQETIYFICSLHVDLSSLLIVPNMHRLLPRNSNRNWFPPLSTDSLHFLGIAALLSVSGFCPSAPRRPWTAAQEKEIKW